MSDHEPVVIKHITSCLPRFYPSHEYNAEVVCSICHPDIEQHSSKNTRYFRSGECLASASVFVNSTPALHLCTKVFGHRAFYKGPQRSQL